MYQLNFESMLTNEMAACFRITPRTFRKMPKGMQEDLRSQFQICTSSVGTLWEYDTMHLIYNNTGYNDELFLELRDFDYQKWL